MSINDDVTFDHESYGMISVSRMSGPGDTSLFGSSLENCPSMICVTICEGQRLHSLGHDRFYGKKELIRLWMTPMQYAEMISNPNVGFGVPCTIRHIHGKAMELPPKTPTEADEVRTRFKLESDDLIRKAKDGATKVKARLAEAKISQKLKDDIQNTFNDAVRFLWDVAPFLVTSFQDATQKTVNRSQARNRCIHDSRNSFGWRPGTARAAHET